MKTLMERRGETASEEADGKRTNNKTACRENDEKRKITARGEEARSSTSDALPAPKMPDTDGWHRALARQGGALHPSSVFFTRFSLSLYIWLFDEMPLFGQMKLSSRCIYIYVHIHPHLIADSAQNARQPPPNTSSQASTAYSIRFLACSYAR